MKTKTEIPIHKFTHTGKHVLLVKVLNRDGTTHEGFVWPKSGPVKPNHWSRKSDCESGGLFGWPWGMFISDGKDPNACAEWLVFSALPENVIWLDGKCKAVPGEDGTLPEVVYRGTQAGAMAFTLMGRIAWIQECSSGSASATGYSGSASATGYSGSASATGDRGSASATGDRGSASATGYSGSASATGDRGSASATGYSGSASATGYSGSASATGYSGSASAMGYSGSASATGDRGIALAVLNYATVEVVTGIAVCTADRFFWKYRTHAVLVCRWNDPKDNKKWPAEMISEVGKTVKDGDILKIEFGKIVKEFKD